MLTTTREVIEKLGGFSAVAKLTGRTYDAAWNWGRFETFPSDTFLVLTRALEAEGCEAPPSLWSMTEPQPTEQQGAA